jgi:hypothetical protein
MRRTRRRRPSTRGATTSGTVKRSSLEAARRDRDPAKVSASARGGSSATGNTCRNGSGPTGREPDAYERSLRSNRESNAAAQAQAAGLPPKNVKRSPARERRAHEAEAEQFYERLQTPAERKRLMDGYRPLDEATLASWRERSPLARRRTRSCLGSAALDRAPAAPSRSAKRREWIPSRTPTAAAVPRRRRGAAATGIRCRRRQEYLAAGGDRHTASCSSKRLSRRARQR